MSKTIPDPCRTCLSQDDLSPIFLQREHCERYTFALFLTTGLLIEYNDGMPQKICKSCVDFINNALQFRARCHSSEKNLRIHSAKLKSKEKNKRSHTYDVDVKNECFDDAFGWSDSEYVPLSETKLVTEKELSTHKDKRKNKDAQATDTYEVKIEENLDNLLIKREAVETTTDRMPSLCLDVNTLKQNIKKSESAKVLKEKQKRMYESLIVGGRKNNGPFECKMCGKVLKIWSSFRTHAKIHLGFDFMCEHCGKKFVAVTMLRRHMMALHGAEKTYICKICGHREHNSDRLKIHMRRTHTGERPYVCDKCGADFFSRRYLIFHLAVHETQRNSQCTQCPAKFKSPQRLACHVSKVHRLRNCRLACYLCECSYTKYENVKRHVVKAHGGNSWVKSCVRKVTTGVKEFEIK